MEEKSPYISNTYYNRPKLTQNFWKVKNAITAIKQKKHNSSSFSLPKKSVIEIELEEDDPIYCMAQDSLHKRLIDTTKLHKDLKQWNRNLSPKRLYKNLILEQKLPKQIAANIMGHKNKKWKNVISKYCQSNTTTHKAKNNEIEINFVHEIRHKSIIDQNKTMYKQPNYFVTTNNLLRNSSVKKIKEHPKLPLFKEKQKFPEIPPLRIRRRTIIENPKIDYA